MRRMKRVVTSRANRVMVAVATPRVLSDSIKDFSDYLLVI